MATAITTSEAARRLKIHQASVRRLCAKIGLARVGRDWLLTDDDFIRLAAEAHGTPGNPGGKHRK